MRTVPGDVWSALVSGIEIWKTLIFPSILVILSDHGVEILYTFTVTRTVGPAGSVAMKA